MTRALASWRPFTHLQSASSPIEIAHARGATLFGADGKSYIDAIASWWVITHGHCHPHIVDAVRNTADKIDQIVFANFTHEPARLLLHELSGMLPDQLAAAFFSDNGSTSVEVALKMALQYWRLVGEKKKNKIVSFVGAYHGDTAGCMSVSARGLFTEPYQAMLFDVVKFEEALASFSDDTAAVIIEPLVQGAGGMIMWERMHLRNVLNAARAKDILVIFDEVMTGFYRTGSRFAFEALDFVPDILCLSKGLTGGCLPLALTVCHERIYQQFLHDDMSRTFFHGHTFTANPISCAAAAANLQLMNQGVSHKISTIEAIHRRRMESATSPLIKSKRMCGTIAALELHASDGYLSLSSHFISSLCLKHGVFLRPIGNVVYIMPPFCITEEELSHVWDVLELAISLLEDDARNVGCLKKRLH